jgi:hypothetical protein
VLGASSATGPVALGAWAASATGEDATTTPPRDAEGVGEQWRHDIAYNVK